MWGSLFLHAEVRVKTHPPLEECGADLLGRATRMLCYILGALLGRSVSIGYDSEGDLDIDVGDCPCIVALIEL